MAQNGEKWLRKPMKKVAEKFGGKGKSAYLCTRF
jgi:hypothetical protein